MLLKYNWPTTWWFNASIKFKMIITVKFSYTCHHTKILYWYWLYSPNYTFHTRDSFILQLEVSTSLFPSPNPFFPQPPHLWWLSVLCIYDSVSALLCLFIYSSDFTYRWSLAVFVFLWLISLNRTPLRSIHVVANGSISFFLWWTVFRGVCVCVYTPHLL